MNTHKKSDKKGVSSFALEVKVRFYNGARRELRSVLFARPNGVCVLPDKQFVLRRRIIAFPGLHLKGGKGIKERLKWLSCLAWPTRDEKKVRKRQRWKEFHRKRRELKLQRKVLSAKRVGVCVPPPQDSEECIARRIMGTDPDPRKILVAVRALTYPAQTDGLTLNHATAYLLRNKVRGFTTNTYSEMLRITELTDRFVTEHALDEFGSLHVRDLSPREYEYTLSTNAEAAYKRIKSYKEALMSSIPALFG